MEIYDFSGWATRNDLKCSDGRVIRKDAFKHNDGQTVPLVWNHRHDESFDVLGHAQLENREEGVYAYCKFNDTDSGKNARLLVQHGDVNQLSIYANQLQQQGPNVMHGTIREVSLVLAGANPGAFIDNVLKHGAEVETEAVIYTDEFIELYHSEEGSETKDSDTKKEEKEEKDVPEKEKTIKEIIDGMTEEERDVMYYLIGEALDNSDDENEGEGETMKQNAFDVSNESTTTDAVLTHADQQAILKMAKDNRMSFQTALNSYMQENGVLEHGFVDEEGNEAIESLFPEYKDLRPGAPELMTRDQGWVGTVMQKTHKSPISRIRTKHADGRGTDLRAYGYKKGEEKKLGGNIKLLNRTTDPQTVYVKEKLNRDDIIDITDFDVVAYLRNNMRQNLMEELALAIMIGDGREDGEEDKIYQEHIRSIWNDDELYTIHADVDIEAARKELQGTNTSANFGENYIYAEAIITAALYSREKYKGSGNVDFYCTPHLLNVMLLARDLNGRRIYDSKTDLAAALNVGAIHTVEQFEGRTRKTKDGDTKKLLGLFVNLSDYTVGSTKGGEITSFNQFDIDYNQEKYLIETRLSGALTRPFSAIALEEPASEVAAG